MAGTTKGGQVTAIKNKKKDPNFYRKIGAMGGRKGKTGGFAAGDEGRRRASIWGSIGGQRSHRGMGKKAVFTKGT
jgi:general stress protein YciG